jgi:predicted peroxiredoxin
MYFTSSTVRWLFEGVARNAYTDEEETRTVLDFIREARLAGVKIFGCTMALAEHRHEESMIAEIDGVAGTEIVIGAAAEVGTRALVF